MSGRKTTECELDSKQKLGPKNKTLSKFIAANERESDIGSDWESFSADSDEPPKIEENKQPKATKNLSLSDDSCSECALSNLSDIVAA